KAALVRFADTNQLKIDGSFELSQGSDENIVAFDTLDVGDTDEQFPLFIQTQVLARDLLIAWMKNVGIAAVRNHPNASRIHADVSGRGTQRFTHSDDTGGFIERLHHLVAYAGVLKPFFL